MRFKGIKKREEGQFITRYDVAYETVDQKEKIYEIISRNKMLDSIEALNGGRPDSVVIIATDESSERLLVRKGCESVGMTDLSGQATARSDSAMRSMCAWWGRQGGHSGRAPRLWRRLNRNGLRGKS